MSRCTCMDGLEIPERHRHDWLVMGETIHTAHGCYHVSLFRGTDGELWLRDNPSSPIDLACVVLSAPLPGDEDARKDEVRRRAEYVARMLTKAASSRGEGNR